MIFLLVACADGGEESISKDSNEKGEDELILAVQFDASGLDPQSTSDRPSINIQANIFETLVETDEDNEIQPNLAEDWKQIDDTTWEFKLREGVKFHNGEIFTADAVKMSFERILNPEVGAPRAFLFDMISDIEIVDEYTVQFKTGYPFTPLVSHLSHPAGSILSPESIEADYETMEKGELPGTIINENPIGTGYFKYGSRISGQETKLLKNDEYWGEPALVDAVLFKVTPDSGTRLAELETGYAHIIKPVPPNQVSEINESGAGEAYVKISSSLAYIGFNTEKEPFNDVRVRQAISMLIDEEELLAGIYDGYGTVANGPLAPDVFGHDQNVLPIEYDVETAKALLKEAGYENGFNTTVWTDDHPQRKDIAVLVQQKLSEVGIKAEIELMELGVYLTKTGAGEHDILVLNLSNPLSDPNYLLNSLFHSSSKGLAGNRAFYGSDVVDQLLEEGRKTNDSKERLNIYSEVQKQLIEDAPMIYTHHEAYIGGVSEKVEGFSINGAGTFQLQKVKFRD